MALPQLSQLLHRLVAKSSILETSPHNSTMRSLTSSGFLLCCSCTDSMTCLTEWLMTFGLPFFPSKQISALALEYEPIPIKLVPFLFFFIHVNATVLYSNPHDFITTTESPWMNPGHLRNITHRCLGRVRVGDQQLMVKIEHF